MDFFLSCENHFVFIIFGSRSTFQYFSILMKIKKYLSIISILMLFLFGCGNQRFETPSGVKIEVLREGSGSKPKYGQIVTVHYTGWLTDSTMFDSSHNHGGPFTFQLGVRQVIQGWDDGVATMKVGGISKLIIPSELGYGNAGMGEIIPPKATLIFEIELLGIK